MTDTTAKGQPPDQAEMPEMEKPESEKLAIEFTDYTWPLIEKLYLEDGPNPAAEGPDSEGTMTLHLGVLDLMDLHRSIKEAMDDVQQWFHSEGGSKSATLEKFVETELETMQFALEEIELVGNPVDDDDYDDVDEE